MPPNTLVGTSELTSHNDCVMREEKLRYECRCRQERLCTTECRYKKRKDDCCFKWVFKKNQRLKVNLSKALDGVDTLPVSLASFYYLRLYGLLGI